MNSTKTSFKAEFGQLVLLIGLLLVARSTLADHYYVPSGSMEHTLQVGDRVLVDKRAYGLRVPFTDVDIVPQEDVGRGEIVIFDSPKDGTRLIKRIVAVGGDRVSLQGGHLVINGVPLASPGDRDVERFNLREAFLNLAHGGGPNVRDIRVPEGMLLALGDHRGRSVDGRYFGFIEESRVYGRALGVYHRKGEGFTWVAL